MFQPRTDHGDAVILKARSWLADHLSTYNPVEETATRSGLSERSFRRRFRKATGYSPLAYTQRLRLELAKKKLETTGMPIEAIG